MNLLEMTSSQFSACKFILSHYTFLFGLHFKVCIAVFMLRAVYLFLFVAFIQFCIVFREMLALNHWLVGGVEVMDRGDSDTGEAAILDEKFSGVL